MNIVRYDPFRELTQMRHHWLFHQNQNFDQPYGRDVQGEETQSVGSTWTPLVDVFEDSEAITLKFELPEVAANDLDIQVEGNALTLRGERKLERADKQEGYHRIERAYGNFARTFTLPSTVEMGEITAESREGVLRISLPKTAETKPRQIKVRTEPGVVGCDQQKQ
jgi:HSP20 family protein